MAKNLHQGPAVQGPSYEIANCAVCGHSNARVVAEQDDVRAEVESLWDFHQHRLRPRTPPDRLMDRVAFSEHPPMRLVQCNECGLDLPQSGGANARAHADLRQGSSADAGSRNRCTTRRCRRCARRQRSSRKHLRGGGSVLEVGSYVGAFLAAAREQGLSAEGIDINAGVNCFTRSLGFTVHDGELESFDAGSHDSRRSRSGTPSINWPSRAEPSTPRTGSCARRRRARHSRAERCVLRAAATRARLGKSRPPRHGARDCSRRTTC